MGTVLYSSGPRERCTVDPTAIMEERGDISVEFDLRMYDDYFGSRYADEIGESSKLYS